MHADLRFIAHFPAFLPLLYFLSADASDKKLLFVATAFRAEKSVELHAIPFMMEKLYARNAIGIKSFRTAVGTDRVLNRNRRKTTDFVPLMCSPAARFVQPAATLWSRPQPP
jgi:hypothetical protein